MPESGCYILNKEGDDFCLVAKGATAPQNMAAHKINGDLLFGVPAVFSNPGVAYRVFAVKPDHLDGLFIKRKEL